MPLKIKTPPTEEPVTLQSLKDWCRVTHSDEDALLAALITTARIWAEQFTGRAFLPTVYEYSIPEFPDGSVLELPTAPVSAVASVAYVDSSGAAGTVSATTYNVETAAEPGRIVLKYAQSWPTVTLEEGNAVTVTFTAGYASADAVPEAIKSAIKLLATAWYTNREDFVTGGSQIVSSAKIPRGAEALLWPYRVFTRGSM